LNQKNNLKNELNQRQLDSKYQKMQQIELEKQQQMERSAKEKEEQLAAELELERENQFQSELKAEAKAQKQLEKSERKRKKQIEEKRSLVLQESSMGDIDEATAKKRTEEIEALQKSINQRKLEIERELSLSKTEERRQEKKNKHHHDEDEDNPKHVHPVKTAPVARKSKVKALPRSMTNDNNPETVGKKPIGGSVRVQEPERKEKASKLFKTSNPFSPTSNRKSSNLSIAPADSLPNKSTTGFIGRKSSALNFLKPKGSKADKSDDESDEKRDRKSSRGKLSLNIRDSSQKEKSPVRDSRKSVTIETSSLISPRKEWISPKTSPRDRVSSLPSQSASGGEGSDSSTLAASTKKKRNWNMDLGDHLHDDETKKIPRTSASVPNIVLLDSDDEEKRN